VPEGGGHTTASHLHARGRGRRANEGRARGWGHRADGGRARHAGVDSGEVAVGDLKPVGAGR
jgi:hypothetical protein